MAVRDDVVIYWNLSPRIILVQSPSTEITMQDLVDTCRNLEADLNAIDDDYLLSAAGKENLGGGVYVGITVTLNNAKLKFEDRPGPTWVRCDVSGGNLVAVDENGDDMDSIAPSSYVTVTRTSSASATLQELSIVAFSGYVWIDTVLGVSGTTYPIGSSNYPVNNEADAITIAESNNLHAFKIRGAITLSSDYEGYIFESIGAGLNSLITIAGGEFNNCVFVGPGLLGTMTGANNRLDTAGIVSLSGYSGQMHTSVLIGPFTLGTGIVYTRELTAYDTSYIDMGSVSELHLQVRGETTIKNMVAGQFLEVIALPSAKITLDSSCTGGNIELRGVGYLKDNSGGAVTINYNYLINPESIADDVWGELANGHTTAGTFGGILGELDGVSDTVNTISVTVSGIEVTVDNIDTVTELLKDASWNKKVLTKISDTQYKEELYDDAGLVIIRTHNLTKSGDVETRQ